MLLTRKYLPILAGIILGLADGKGLATEDMALHYAPNEEFSAMSRRGNPKDINRGGGKRGCLSLVKARDEEYLQAVVPVADGGGVSGATQPTFWVYSPYTAAKPLQGILALRRANDFKALPLQKVTVVLPSKPGLVGIKLPKSIHEKGLLTWSLTVVCDEAGGNESRNPYVVGLVLVRPNAALNQRIAVLSPSEKVQAYARSGYWYDAWTAAEGDDIRRKLLKAAGMKIIAIEIIQYSR
jgi:Domain of Unknown Function (DUF928)